MSKTPSGAPDSHHFHQLIMQLVQLRLGDSEKRNGWANPTSTLILLPLAVIPIVVSLLLIQNNKAAILIYLILVACYFILYVLLVKKVKSIALSNGKVEIVYNLNHIFKPKVR